MDELGRGMEGNGFLLERFGEVWKDVKKRVVFSDLCLHSI